MEETFLIPDEGQFLGPPPIEQNIVTESNDFLQDLFSASNTAPKTEISEKDEQTDLDAEATTEQIQNIAVFREQAKVYVDSFDSLQTTVYENFIYPKCLYQDGDQDWLVANYLHLNTKQKNALEQKIIENPEAEEVLAIISRHKAILVYKASLPYSQAEKKKLIEPLAKILQRHNSKEFDNPYWALAFGLLFINLPRMQPIMPNVFAGIDNLSKKYLS